MRESIEKFFFLLDNLFVYIFSFKPLRKIFSLVQNLSERSNVYYIIIIIFILGILLRSLLPLLEPGSHPLDISLLNTDSAVYSQISISLIENHFPLTSFPPGFSLVLSVFYLIFGYNLIPPIIFLIIISSFLGIIAYFISLELFNNKTVALLSLILITLNPILIRDAALLRSDTLALVFFAFIIFLSIKDYKSATLKYSVIIGLLIGFLILIRPSYFYLGIIYFFLIILSNRNSIKFNFKLKKIALFFVGGLIIISPWMYFTYTTIGEPTISTNNGLNFYIGNSPEATGRYFDPIGPTNNMTLEEMDEGKEPYKRGVNYLLTNTTSAARLYVQKTYISIFEAQFFLIYNPFMYFYNIIFIMTELLGILGLIKFRTNRVMFYYFLTCVLSVYLTLIVFFILPRFTLPLVFILTIFGSYYIVKLYNNS